MSRMAYVDVFADERGPTCARILRDTGEFSRDSAADGGG